ncbi:MAG: lipoprotein [Pseudomonadota bacterium]|nr:lipoprotein [Pseudomonadota bacterium]MEC8287881.1 lipoprotein [Pseudomonadota bacterium]MEC8425849.1 lipoprotein [Pseudomonadota bacterium]MEC8452568.1 lipoprotein [Pseudomonadota bacterium]
MNKRQKRNALTKLIMAFLLLIILSACGVKGDIELEKKSISEKTSILDRLI